MGVSQSFMSQTSNQSQSITSQGNKMFVNIQETLSLEESSFLDFFENPITDDLLIEILAFVPSRDLLLSCQLVCKRWKELIDGQSVWKRKCEEEKIRLPNISRKLQILPRHHYRYIYQYSSSEQNLLKNPCGEENLLGWEVLNSFGDGFAVEKPIRDNLYDPVPSEVGSKSCFVTSYGPCKKYQLIDLHKEEYNKYLVLNNLVTIKVGEWYSSRRDCGSWYELKVQLLTDSECIDSFMYRYDCDQWTPGQWFFIGHEFKDISKARYVRFEHIGCDTQFWAGHYGSRFTGGFVKLCLI